MATLLDRVLVVDVEATCWETREEQGDRPNEVIEIGIAELVVATGEVRDVFSYIVKPKFTTVSPFCTQLTGWTQEEVNEGADIGSVIAAIKHDYHLDKDNVWCSYGEYDRVKLGSLGGGSLKALYGIERHHNIFAQMRHFNVKTLFALKHKLKREIGMDRALALVGETLEGRHHNGADDAANIAKLVRCVLA